MYMKKGYKAKRKVEKIKHRKGEEDTLKNEAHIKKGGVGVDRIQRKQQN